MRQRGFNQSELLARELREPPRVCEPVGELVRTRPTPPQVGHDRLRRFENVQAGVRVARTAASEANRSC